MIVRAKSSLWQFDYKFTMNDCDIRGNVYSSSAFRVSELARDQFLRERVEGYSALIEDGLQVLIADAKFEFQTEFLPFDRVACIVTAMEVDESEAAVRFQFRHLESGQTYAETRQVFRFADSNQNPIYVPGPIRRALISVLENRKSETKSSRHLAAAG